MTYENAPAAAMVATHCAVCARPLVDALSVELGIGPDCRKRYAPELFAGASGLSADRAEANAHLHWVAIHQDSAEVRERVARIHALGFPALAERIAKRLGCVRIEQDGDTFLVRAPFNPEHVERLRRVPGRRWDSASKADRIPLASKAALWAALVAVHAGRLGIGPKGMFLFASRPE
jgi:hypothetical protein